MVKAVRETFLNNEYSPEQLFFSSEYLVTFCAFTTAWKIFIY